MTAAGCVKTEVAFPILVVSSDNQVQSALAQILRSRCRLRCAGGRRSALSLFRRFQPWVVVCDQHLHDGDWRDLLKDLQGESPAPPLIVSSRLADDRLWAEVLNLGGYDLLTRPFAAAEVSRVVNLAAYRASSSAQA